jgi:hypothetical protein
MKKILLLIIGFLSFNVGYGQKFSFRMLPNGDTVIVNYSIASGELGKIHEGIIITKEDDKFKAVLVAYNFGTSILPNGLVKVDGNVPPVRLEPDSIKHFFQKIKGDFFVAKEERLLNLKQISYLEKFLNEAEDFESHGFSNAAEYYYIIRKGRELLVLDRSGKWGKHKDLKKVLNL